MISTFTQEKFLLNPKNVQFVPINLHWINTMVFWVLSNAFSFHIQMHLKVLTKFSQISWWQYAKKEQTGKLVKHLHLLNLNNLFITCLWKHTNSHWHTHTHNLTKRGYPVLISFRSFFPTTSKTVDFVKFSFENVNTLLCVRVCLTLWVYYLFYTSFWLHICFLWRVCVCESEWLWWIVSCVQGHFPTLV